MKLFYLVLCFSIVCYSCSNDEIPEHVKKAEYIMHITAKQLETEYDLSLITDGGSMMYDIQVISLGFTSSESLNIDQARQLIVSCSKIFLNNINETTDVSDYLNNYPATDKNIELDIYFQKHGQSKHPPYVAVVSLYKGLIIYYHKYEYLKEIHKESYEEALKKVNE